MIERVDRSYRQEKRPIILTDDSVLMLDQRRLPGEERWDGYETAEEVAEAIKVMVIRGAPAIACAAAMGVAAGARRLPHEPEAFTAGLEQIFTLLANARPTAVNLTWAVDQQRAVAQRHAGQSIPEVRQALADHAQRIWTEDVGFCRAMGRHGAALIPDGATVLTHCNTGALATGGHGTALGVIRSTVEAGKKIKVLADETRPFLQGARLTAWELMQDDIDVTVIPDGAAGALMASGEVTCAVVGSDRIAANGDVANKIGTYSVAVLASHHGIPFYVAAPRTTVDMAVATGAEIPIEERTPREVTHVGDTRIVPPGCKVRNIAFDVTPAELVTAIITEVGVAKPPYTKSLAEQMKQ
jgi:methylthioribose-1-phosphate isomerase